MTMKKPPETFTKPSLKTPDGVTDQLAKDFISGAETERLPKGEYPWESPYCKENNKRPVMIFLPEPLKLKLDFIAEHTPHSRAGFVVSHIKKLIEAETKLLIKKGHVPKK